MVKLLIILSTVATAVMTLLDWCCVRVGAIDWEADDDN